ncbi:MAG: DNA helicase RecG, partial [Candidatus Limnocylindria bacterium]
MPERAIADLLAEEEVAISGEVRGVSLRRPSRRLSVYPASEDVSVKKLRELAGYALPDVADFVDPLPASVKERAALPGIADALAALHRPRSLAEAEQARRRLALDELLVLQLGLARSRRGREALAAPALGQPAKLAARYRAVLPFALTPDQERAVAEIDADLARPVPM